MIEIEKQDGMTIVRMTHGRANVMDIELCQALSAQITELNASPTGAIVLTGSSGIFSAGVDLLRLVNGGGQYIRAFLPQLSAMLTAVFSCPKPVVAAINGHAIAGGCVLACAADKRLMAREAGRIGVTELLVGVPFPAAALEIMRSAVAPQHFEDVTFSGRTYTPSEAAERGLVHEITEGEDLLERAIACAKALARLPPAAFALTKREIRRSALEALRTDVSRAEVEQAWTTPDTLARIRDYVRRTLGKS